MRAPYKRLISGQLVGLYMTSLGIVSVQSTAMKLHGRSFQEESQGGCRPQFITSSFCSANSNRKTYAMVVDDLSEG